MASAETKDRPGETPACRIWGGLRRGAVLPLLIAAGLAPPLSAAANGTSASPQTGDIVELRSPELPKPLMEGVRSERLALTQAQQADTNAALILFLMRFPDGPEADEARVLLSLRRSPDPAGSATGPDADIIAAFDAARLADNPSALQHFIAGHGQTPLAAEAQRLLAQR